MLNAGRRGAALEQIGVLMDPEKLAMVRLIPLDEFVLEELVQAAITDATADEVTPPFTTDGSWTPARADWLRAFHRERRLGLDGPTAEATWAVLLDGRVVGSVRLERTEVPDVVETGIWLARAARGRGVGRAALGAVLEQAAAAGARAVRADTTTGNAGALGVLTHLGFHLTPGHNGHVHALVLLRS